MDGDQSSSEGEKTCNLCCYLCTYVQVRYISPSYGQRKEHTLKIASCFSNQAGDASAVSQLFIHLAGLEYNNNNNNKNIPISKYRRINCIVLSEEAKRVRYELFRRNNTSYQ